MFQWIKKGAMAGAVAWTIYWVAESLLLSIVPWFLTPAYMYGPTHAGFTALLPVIYLAIGAVTGAAAGMVVGLIAASGRLPKAESVVKPLVILILCGAMMFSVVRQRPGELPLWFEALVFIGVVLCLGISALAPGRLSPIANAWVATAMILMPPWILSVSSPNRTVLTLAAIEAGILVVASVISLAGRSVFRSRSRSRIVLASIVCVTLGACVLMKQTVRVTPSAGSARPADGVPNVILITLDTVRADHVSVYGYARDTTPNLRRLAEESTVYLNAIAAGDMTLSSHASLFTGLYVSWHDAHFDPAYPAGRPLAPGHRTLAELLGDKGFDTIGAISNYPFLGQGFGLDRGFQYYDQRVPVPFLGSVMQFFIRQRVRNLLIRWSDPASFALEFRRAEDVNASALSAIDQRTAGRPLFGFLNYMDAHWPYLPPIRFRTLYPGYRRQVAMAYWPRIAAQVMSLIRPLRESERQHCLSQYDAGIAYEDWAIGELVRELKTRGLYDNTLLIIAADHGEAFGEKALLGHGVSVYQNQVHVPLIIKYPHQTAKDVVRENVSLVDIVPTVFDVLRLEAPKGIQGISLLKLPGDRPREIISESFIRRSMLIRNPRLRPMEKALFLGPLKLIESSGGKLELYDLSADPNEERNLPDGAERTELDARLRRFLASARQGGSGRQPEVDKQTMEKLKSLGYVQ